MPLDPIVVAEQGPLTRPHGLISLESDRNRLCDLTDHLVRARNPVREIEGIRIGEPNGWMGRA